MRMDCARLHQETLPLVEMMSCAMDSIKLAAHRVFRSLGVDIVRYPEPPAPPAPPAPRSYAGRRRRWLSDLGVTVLFDVGANVGQYGRQVRSEGFSGRIVSFEPMADEFARLSSAVAEDPRWRCLNVALGDTEGDFAMHIAGNSESSSLLAMRENHVAAYPESAVVGTQSVRVETLDALRAGILEPGDRAWLKMDVQGYELTTLRGASETLRQVQAVEMELSVVELYDGNPLLCESIGALENLGFHLAAIEEAFLDGRDARVLQLNGIFLRWGHGANSS